jgi:ribosomal protein L11 methyltransferase
MDRGAFGSGEHETTRSCITLLENLTLHTESKILDLGSGTGILTIAALILNPLSHACCVDIDPKAIESGKLNCCLNNIETRVEYKCGTLQQVTENNFDLILANIYGDILLDVADALVAKASQGSYILLSGILWEYHFDIKQSYRRLGCELVKSLLLEEFSTMLFRKL